MKNEETKRNYGLLGLFALLLIADCAIRQLRYYAVPAVVILMISVAILIILWRYLLQNKLIAVTWASMTNDPQKHKSERIFLFSLVVLVAPVLGFHNITTSDIVTSIIAILVGFIGYTINERYLRKKNKN